MPEFPKLRTGARAQYPLSRRVIRPVKTLEFVDGSEQRYSPSRPRRAWVVELAKLSQTEAAQLVAFARQYFDSLERFTFVDPADGATYPRCRLETDAVALTAQTEARRNMRFVIREDED